MEPKKNKKLVINQEVISNLNANAMSRIKGGSDYFCTNTGCVSKCIATPVCAIFPHSGYADVLVRIFFFNASIKKNFFCCFVG